ncbi:hypothetical protein AAY473_005161 [Plecturocebus cupreus]
MSCRLRLSLVTDAEYTFTAIFCSRRNRVHCPHAAPVPSSSRSNRQTPPARPRDDLTHTLPPLHANMESHSVTRLEYSGVMLAHYNLRLPEPVLRVLQWLLGKELRSEQGDQPPTSHSDGNKLKKRP